MNRGEDEFARTIVQRLDESAARLDAGTHARLVAARTAALARYPGAPALGLAGNVRVFVELHLFGARIAAVVTALMIATASVVYWQSAAPNGDLADLEISLLTDELPINAYLDKGFDSWLKRSPR